MKTKKNEQNIKFGNKLKLARETLGLTQEKVAEYLGLGPRYISDIERNKTKGSIDTLIKLCNIYNITPNDLLSEYIYFNLETNNIRFDKILSFKAKMNFIIPNNIDLRPFLLAQSYYPIIITLNIRFNSIWH